VTGYGKLAAQVVCEGGEEGAFDSRQFLSLRKKLAEPTENEDYTLAMQRIAAWMKKQKRPLPIKPQRRNCFDWLADELEAIAGTGGPSHAQIIAVLKQLNVGPNERKTYLWPEFVNRKITDELLRQYKKSGDIRADKSNTSNANLYRVYDVVKKLYKRFAA
jgi:hypothetical protein